jgi:glycolate oxidase FAD binding subunit
MRRNGTFEASIRAAVPKARIASRRRLPDYAVDGMLPAIAVSPANAEETAAVLAAAGACEAAVIPWGGGSGMMIGNIPARYDLALDLTHQNRVLAHVAEDLTVVVQAGVRLRDLQEHLAHRGQYLPLDPPFPEKATIGGILASNAGGPWRHAYGWPRDWLLGMKVALPDGGIVKCGGRVVKNVAGYDVGKLFMGSFGTLGVILEAAFKVLPVPASRMTAMAFFESPVEAVQAALAVHARNLRVESLDVLNPEAAKSVLGREARAGLCCLILSAAGNHAAVDRTLKDTAEVCEGFGAMLTALATQRAESIWTKVRAFSLGSVKDEVGLRISVPSSQVAELLQSPLLSSKTAKYISRPALGGVYSWLPCAKNALPSVAELRALAAGLGGIAVVESCPPSLRPTLGTWPDASPAAGLMAKVKEALDPGSIMSPGRFVGGL